MEEVSSNQTDELTFKLVSDLKQYLSLIGPALLCSQPEYIQVLNESLQRSFAYEQNDDLLGKFASSVDSSMLVIEWVNNEGKNQHNSWTFLLKV